MFQCNKETALHEGVWESSSVKFADQQPDDIAYSDHMLAYLGLSPEGTMLDAHQQIHNCNNAVPSVKAKRHPRWHLHKTDPSSCVLVCVHMQWGSEAQTESINLLHVCWH